MRGFAVLLRLILLVVVVSAFVAPGWYADVPTEIVFEPFSETTHVIAAGAIAIFLLIEIIAFFTSEKHREQVKKVGAAVTAIPGKIAFRPKLIEAAVWDQQLADLAAETGRYYAPVFSTIPSESNNFVTLQLSDSSNGYTSAEKIFIDSDAALARLESRIEHFKRRLFHEYVIVLRNAHRPQVQPVRGTETGNPNGQAPAQSTANEQPQMTVAQPVQQPQNNPQLPRATATGRYSNQV